MESRAHLPDATRLGSVHLRTANASKLAQFYSDVIGLKVYVQTSNAIGLGVSEFKPLMALYEDKAAVTPSSLAPGLFHTAFLVPTRIDLGLFLIHLVDTGHRLSGAADHIVSEALYLTDPDGNGIEVYRDRPKDEWRYALDGEVQMSSDPLDIGSIIQDAESSGRTWNGMPKGTTIGHVHLRVSNVGRSAEFYNNTVGLDITQSSYPGACFLSVGGYHHHLGINSWQTANTPAAPPNSTGLMKWELVVPGLSLNSTKAIHVDPDGIMLQIRSS